MAMTTDRPEASPLPQMATVGPARRSRSRWRWLISREAVFLQFVALAALSLSATTVGPVRELRLVLFAIAGFATMAAVNVRVTRSPRSSSPWRRPTVIFNTALVVRRIDEGWEGMSRGISAPAHRTPDAPDDLTPRRFVGQDNALALAYLRLELERALLRVARLNLTGSMLAKEQRPPARQLAEILVHQKILPQGMLAALNEILATCNGAVHGGIVSDETALAVVSTAEEILQYLERVAPR